MASSTENTKGALIMMASMAAFTFNDTVFKTVAGQIPLFQAIFIRGCIVSLGLLIVVLVTRQVQTDLPARDWKLIGARTVGDIGATALFLTALINAPIADVTAILQAAPLVLTLAGALILGEKVGWRRYSAIAIGLTGVLLIVQPGSGGFNPNLLYAVGALGFVLLRDLPTRSLSSKVPSMFVAFLTSTAITICAGFDALSGNWIEISQPIFLRLAAAAFFIFGAYTFAVMVMRVGDMGFVQPFRFTAIIWAILLGYFVFGDVPNALSVLGTAIVISMGVYTFYRERRRRG